MRSLGVGIMGVVRESGVSLGAALSPESEPDSSALASEPGSVGGERRTLIP